MTVVGATNIATSATITNVEELRFTNSTAVGGGGALGLGATNVNANLVNVSGVNKFLLDGASNQANTGVLTLNNSALAAGGTTIQYTGDGAAASQSFNGVSFNPTGAGGGADSVTVTVGNGGTAVGTGNNLTINGGLTLVGIENVAVTAADVATGNTLNLGGVNAAGTAIQTFTATVAGNLDLGSNLGVAGSGTITNANFSGVSGLVSNAGGALTISNAANASITLAGNGDHNVSLDGAVNNAGNINAASASGILTLNGAGGDDTIVGGSGNDTITGGGGNDSIDLTAGGNDTVVFGATAAANGVDTITGYNAGNDRLDVSAFETAGALVALDPAAGPLTTTAGTVYYLGGQVAGAADSTAAAAAAITAGSAAWTSAAATAWVVISDNNSTAVYEWADDGASAGAQAGELTLVATLDAAATTAQLAAGIVI